ncbi:head GIN domain-containing protein [Sphingomonas sp. Leaf4]|uniref:head GIN domain-containing protein n=1 Tax=Sphingomonas sp. Leaf4 TaxID=2876553 RepID=UPI001E2F50D3|nr:head GIN domain-containing protein [Sphingomonas sp. Leaf4]
MRAAMVGLLMMAACSNGGASEPARTAERTVALRGFSGVDLAGPDRVDVVTGRDFAVQARGDAAVLDRLTFEVKGTTLRIARKPQTGWNWRDRTAVIRVTLPALKAATLSGSGDLSIDRAADLTAQLTGSGDMTIARLTGRTARLGLRGSGTIAAAGRVDSLALSLSGSGDIDARQVKASQASVAVAGSGDVSADVDGPAAVSLTGSGSATLGARARCTVRKAGSGEARCGG